MFKQGFQGHNFQRSLIGALQIHWWSNTRFIGLQPAAGTYAPTVSRLQPGKTILGHGADKIVAHAQLELQKFLSDLCTHDVTTQIVGASAEQPSRIKPVRGA